jgi:predicted phage terminase large subunit-like protein
MFNKAEWNTNHGGKCKASGIGGSVTGFGADLFIIDDYVKDQMEAESKTIRDHVWGWWESVAATRLHPNSTVLLIATRWHDDDLIGRILKKKRTEGKDFPFELVEISIPALCVDPKNDLLGRKKDEVIWPSRFSEKRIKYTKSIVGSYYWNAQFMCNPVSRGGILFKRDDFRYFDYDEQTKAYFCYREDKDPIKIMRRALRIYLFCDPAIEEKKKDDPTGMVVIAYAPKEKFFLVLYARSERINARNILKELDLTAKRFGAMKIYVENEKLGKVIRQQSYGSTETPIAEVSHKGLDKYARATPMATHTENERCFFDKYGSWVSEFEEQLVKFPNAEHDEYVDCFAYASTLESRISVAEALRGRRS